MTIEELVAQVIADAALAKKVEDAKDVSEVFGSGVDVDALIEQKRRELQSGYDQRLKEQEAKYQQQLATAQERLTALEKSQNPGTPDSPEIKELREQVQQLTKTNTERMKNEEIAKKRADMLEKLDDKKLPGKLVKLFLPDDSKADGQDPTKSLEPYDPIDALSSFAEEIKASAVQEYAKTRGYDPPTSEGAVAGEPSSPKPLSVRLKEKIAGKK